jgi:sucrose-6-phosphate hydrolase SacC (GH32 family)
MSIVKYFEHTNIYFFPIEKYDNYLTYSGSQMFEDDVYTFIPLRESSTRCGYQHMKEKYELLGFPFEMWHNLIINRDYDAEKRLFDELGLVDGDKYNFINENHQPTFIKIPIYVDNEHKNVYMNKIGEFTMFDWIGVMERAQSIHTIGTSLIFIIDALQTMPEDLHIYSRLDKGHNTYDYLLKKTYIYH